MVDFLSKITPANRRRENTARSSPMFLPLAPYGRATKQNDFRYSNGEERRNGGDSYAATGIDGMVLSLGQNGLRVVIGERDLFGFVGDDCDINPRLF
jgi:hypothetical protein